MFSLYDNCELINLSEKDRICDFDCGNEDLNDFFCNDAYAYQKQLLGQTSFFRLKENGKIICAYTLSNDSIKVDDLPNSRAKKVKDNIPHIKSQKSYPATLIGRFGVDISFARKGIGCQVIDFIKSICIMEDANKCRFILVDAYNNESALNFYSHERNDFKTVFSTEIQERTHYGKAIEAPLKTRFMYYDLIKWANPPN